MISFIFTLSLSVSEEINKTSNISKAHTIKENISQITKSSIVNNSSIKLTKSQRIANKTRKYNESVADKATPQQKTINHSINSTKSNISNKNHATSLNISSKNSTIPHEIKNTTKYTNETKINKNSTLKNQTKIEEVIPKHEKLPEKAKETQKKPSKEVEKEDETKDTQDDHHTSDPGMEDEDSQDDEEDTRRPVPGQEEQFEYGFPTFKLPEFWRDGITKKTYHFPQTQEEFDALPPKFQKAISKILEQKKSQYLNMIMSNPRYKAAYEEYLLRSQQNQDPPQNYENQQTNDNYETVRDYYDTEKYQRQYRSQQKYRDEDVEENEDYQPKPQRQDINPRSRLPPNTEFDGEGRLTCVQGFFGFEPIDYHGCWTCHPSCHYRADCINPGYCKCADGYTGDGVKYCNAPTPFILKAKSVKGVLSAQYIGVNKDFIVREAYCRFNEKIITNATSYGNNTIFCKVPAGQRFDRIRISLDGSSWSEEAHIFNMFSNKQFIQIFIITFCVVGAAVACIVSKCTRGNRKYYDEEPLMVNKNSIQNTYLENGANNLDEAL